MIDFIKELAESARWELEIFEGKLKISGRVLSPIEAQAAGVASRALMSKMMSLVTDKEETEEEEAEQILNKLDSLTAEDVLSFGAMQDRVLCQVVDKVSKDGDSWEKLKLVPHESMQNPARHALWVGVFSQDDKNLIFEKAMSGLKGGEDQLASFQGGS